MTFRLLALTLWLGVFFFFYVDGFTGVVVVFIPEGETVLEKEAIGIVLGFCSGSLGENCLRW